VCFVRHTPLVSFVRFEDTSSSHSCPIVKIRGQPLPFPSAVEKGRETCVSGREAGRSRLPLTGGVARIPDAPVRPSVGFAGSGTVSDPARGVLTEAVTEEQQGAFSVAA
jgi:hypothetical protein